MFFRWVELYDVYLPFGANRSQLVYFVVTTTLHMLVFLFFFPIVKIAFGSLSNAIGFIIKVLPHVFMSYSSHCILSA